MTLLNLIKSSLLVIAKSTLSPKLALLKELGNFKFSIVFGVLAGICYLVYNAISDYEFIRKNIGDVEYDITLKAYSHVSQNPTNAPRIIVVMIDEKYLRDHNLSNGNETLGFNYTPRSLLANILNKLDSKIAGQKPKGVLLDYYLAYSGDINGTVIADDKTLIDALNTHAKEYPIYIPTYTNKMFIQPYLNKSVKFASVQVDQNKDGIIRGYSPYLCKDGKKIAHIAKIFSLTNNNENSECDASYKPSFDEMLNSRILFKRIDDVAKVSNYKNITIYQAGELDNIDEDFNDAIVLIGSDYKNSGDIINTTIDTRSGVLILADTITTASILPNGLKKVHPLIAAMSYTLMFFIITWTALSLMDKFNVKNDTVKTNILLISNILIFFIPASGMIFLGYYLSWAVPMILFEATDKLMIIAKAKNKIDTLAKPIIITVAVALVIIALVIVVSITVL